MIYAFEDCVLDDEKRELWRAASSVSVGPQVFDLLAYLLHNRERVVSQDDLLAAIWEGRIVSDSTLRSHINAARTAIGDDGETQRLIRTMPRKGFRFVGEIRERPAETPTVAPADGATAVAPDAAAPPHAAASIAPRRRYLWAAAAVSVLVIATGVVVLRDRWPADIDSPASAPALPVPPTPAAPPGAAPGEHAQLVPELMPFISDRDREAIRNAYMPAPDHKAIAISFAFMAFVSAQPDKDTAEAAAVAKCRSFTGDKRPGCQLYASGNVLISTRAIPHMPPQPWVIRDPSIETPFAENDVPLLNDGSRRRLTNFGFATEPSLKALAVSATGMWTAFRSDTSLDEVVRRALEWCGYNSGAACMIVAVGDTFVVPIPRTMKVVGFARSGPINAIAPELRDDVARRLANATSGWSAVAVGAGGRVGIKLGAPSEQAAIDGSMEACSRQDRDCRVAVIGPFLVERGP